MSENFEKFNLPSPKNQEEAAKQPETEITPEQMEMPEDFVEPAGKSGKWGEIVENKELGVRYREKVIKLPKHRQQETGIKRIRRRELLPPFPEGIYKEQRENIDRPTWDSNPEFDNIYDFLTDSGYPSPGTWVHTVNWSEIFGPDEKYTRENIKKMRSEGLYFQEINNGLSFSPTRIWHRYFNTPVFIFGNRNPVLNDYIDKTESDKDLLRYLRERNPNVPTTRTNEVALDNFGGEANPEILLRWCHAECALIPTKRSLNVLFFETDEAKETEEEK